MATPQEQSRWRRTTTTTRPWGLRADAACLAEVFAIQHRAMRWDRDRIMALERRVLEGRAP